MRINFKQYGNIGVSSFFTPAQSILLHQASVDWLKKKLAEPWVGPTVVVTHHGPARGSIAPRYANDWLTPAFVSDLAHLMGNSVLWVHGHTHDSVNYVVNGTRVVCNPRGYTNRLRYREEHETRIVTDADSAESVKARYEQMRCDWEKPENPNFQPDLVIEV